VSAKAFLPKEAREVLESYLEEVRGRREGAARSPKGNGQPLTWRWGARQQVIITSSVTSSPSDEENERAMEEMF
jgi:hypothetical protein